MESKKSLANISRKECLGLFPRIYQNAENQWKSASYLAKKGDLATSNFLMITSLEEYLKALILSLDGNGFRFRSIRGIDDMFKNHSSRYPVIYLFHFMVSSLRMPYLLKNRKGTVDKGILLFAKFFEVQRNLEWYSNLDKLRESCLYSNLDNRQINLPNELSEQEYNVTFKNLKKVRYGFRSILIPLNPNCARYGEEKREFIKTLKTMTEDLGLYDSLYEQLRDIKSNGYSSNHLRTIIESFS